MKDRFNTALHGLGSTFPSPDPSRREEFLRSLQEKEERDRAAAALLRARKKPFWYALPAAVAAAIMLTVGIRAYQNNPPHSIPSVPVETTTTAALLPTGSSETITEAVTEAVAELLTTEAASTRPRTETETSGIAQPVSSQPSHTQERPTQTTQPAAAAGTSYAGTTDPRETTRRSAATTVKPAASTTTHTTARPSGSPSQGGNVQPGQPSTTAKSTTRTTTASTKASTENTKAISAVTKASSESTRPASATTRATTVPETIKPATTIYIQPAQTTAPAVKTTDFVLFTTTTPWYMNIHSTAVYTTQRETFCTTIAYSTTEVQEPCDPVEAATMEPTRPTETAACTQYPSADPTIGEGGTDSYPAETDPYEPFPCETEATYPATYPETSADTMTYTVAVIEPYYVDTSSDAPVWTDYEDQYPVGNGHSSEVVYGTVTKVYYFIGDDNLPYTAINVHVDSVLRGSCDSGDLTVIEPGGHIPLEVLCDLDPDIRKRAEKMTAAEISRTPFVNEKGCDLPEVQVGENYVFRLTERQKGGWYCYSDRYALSRLSYQNGYFYTYDGFRMTYDMTVN